MAERTGEGWRLRHKLSERKGRCWGQAHTVLPPYLMESLKSISVYSAIGGAARELAVTEVAGMDSIWDKKAL